MLASEAQGPVACFHQHVIHGSKGGCCRRSSGLRPVHAGPWLRRCDDGGQDVVDRRWIRRPLDLGFDDCLRSRTSSELLENDVTQKRLVVSERLVAADVRNVQIDQDRADVLMLPLDRAR
jgi:hypothetical protein